MNHFLGVSIPYRKNHYCFCFLAENLSIRTLATGLLDEVLAYASANETAGAGVSAPAKLNQGLMGKEEYREKFDPPPPTIRWQNIRFAEYQLVREKVKVYHTPDRLAACPEWMRRGFILYERLSGLDFSPLAEAGESKFWLETPAEAAFHKALGKRLRSKVTLQGRIQRQLLLWRLGIDIPDPMRCFEEITRYRLARGEFPFANVYSPAILQAVAAAYTAWLAVNQPGKLVVIGAQKEGWIHLPARLIQE